jgi:hypothetical protein
MTMTTTLNDPPTDVAESDAGPGLDQSDLANPPMPGRPLWVVFGTILTLATLLWGTFQVVSLIAREQWRETSTVSAAGITTLRVDNDSGRVVVRGGDTEEITVAAELSRGLFGLDESVETRSDELRVDADCPVLGEWCWVNYEITVPRGIDVVISTDNGRAVVSDVAGAVDIETDNGRVELAAVSGSVRARGDNGPIVGTDLRSAAVDAGTQNGSIDLAFTDPPESVIASTSNGSIELALPDVAGDYNVVAPSTDNGRVDVSIASDPASVRVIETSTDNGSITIRPN